MIKTVTKVLFLFTLLFIISCKQNTEDDESWDYVYALPDAKGTWTAKDSIYEYEVFVTEILNWVIVKKRYIGEEENIYYHNYSKSNADIYIKTCKINNKRTKLICPTFGSNIVLCKTY
jgi:hypothetical protein